MNTLKLQKRLIIFISILTPILLVFTANKPALAIIDTDRDGYSDDIEIQHGYDPYSPCGKNIFGEKIFAYNKGRLVNLADEACRANFLKNELQRILNKKDLGIQAKNWHTVVNAFIYGGYSVEDIAAVIKNGAKTVHPTIPKTAWQYSKDYQLTLPPSNSIIVDTHQGQINLRKNGGAIVIDSNRSVQIDSRAIIYGYVYDHFTKKALANAEINLYSLEGEKIKFLKKTISDQSGFYQIIPSSLVRQVRQPLLVKVTKKLYTSAEYKFNYNPLILRQVDFKLSHRSGNSNSPTPTDPTTNQDQEESLLTVIVKDPNSNPLYNVRISAEITQDSQQAVSLEHGSYLTNVAGSASFKGELQEGQRYVNANIEISHKVIEDKKNIKVSFKPNNQQKEITVNYKVPEWVAPRKQQQWQQDVIYARQIYTDLEDDRNRNEVEITVVDQITGQPINNYTVYGLEKFPVLSNDGVAKIDNVEEDLYLANFKVENENNDGYKWDRYFVVNVIPNKRTIATIFIDTSKKQVDYSSN